MQEKKYIDIVVVGGGFGGVYALKELHKYTHKHTHIRLTIVNTTNYFLFTPLLHEVATGGMRADNIVEPLRNVFTCCPLTIHVAKAEHISFEKKEITTNSGSISYDYLILAAGAHTSFFNTPGAEANAYTMKSIDDALRFRGRCVANIEKAMHEKDKEKRLALLHVVIIGGGPTGVEMAAETAELFFDTMPRYYPADILRDMRITLVQRMDTLLPGFDPRVQKVSLDVLEKKGVTVLRNTAVEKIENTDVYLNTGNILHTHLPLWVAGIEANTISSDTQTEKNPKQCLFIEKNMRLKNLDDVFVIGDMSYCEGQPFPALAQVATQQGHAVAKNVIATIHGRPLENMHIKIKGSLVSLGQWRAAGMIGPVFIHGRIAWWIWRTVYLFKVLSPKKRFQIAVDWTVHLFSKRDISDI